jgi:hypothetical protein
MGNKKKGVMHQGSNEAQSDDKSRGFRGVFTSWRKRKSDGRPQNQHSGLPPITTTSVKRTEVQTKTEFIETSEEGKVVNLEPGISIAESNQEMTREDPFTPPLTNPDANVPQSVVIKPAIKLSRTQARQEAEQKLHDATMNLSAAMTGLTTPEIPQQISQPDFKHSTINDISATAKSIGSAIATWQDARVNSDRNRSQLRLMAEKWFKASISFVKLGLEIAAVCPLKPFLSG